VSFSSLLLVDLLYLHAERMNETLSPKALTPAARLKKRGSRFIRFALIFITSVVLVDALVGEKGLLATVRARREYDELAGQIARMRSENARLREAARALREDPDMIEELARRQLGLIKRGEMVFIIKDVTPAERNPPSPKP
jgi:cell division protein FtsB